MAAPLTNGTGDHDGQHQASGILAYAQRSLDRIAPPPSRQKAYDDVSAFAASRPILFAFLVAQLLFSILPLLLFTSFIVSVAATAGAAAALFSIFWSGVAFAVLVPALLLAATGALLVWAWLVAGFLATRWLYRRVPFAADAGHNTNGSQNDYPYRVVTVKEEQAVSGDIADAKQAS